MRDHPQSFLSCTRIDINKNYYSISEKSIKIGKWSNNLRDSRAVLNDHCITSE